MHLLGHCEITQFWINSHFLRFFDYFAQDHQLQNKYDEAYFSSFEVQKFYTDKLLPSEVTIHK